MKRNALLRRVATQPRPYASADSMRTGRETLNVHFDKLPEDDPARAIIATIVGLVPVSDWSFARFKGDAGVNQLFSLRDNGGEFSRLRELYLEQRRTGASIAATVEVYEPDRSGLALIFADGRERFGILSLSRTAQLGPFTSSEIRTLTFALDAASDRFSEIHLMESQGTPFEGFRQGDASEDTSLTAGDSAHYVLNRDLDIVLAWSAEDERRIAAAPLPARVPNRLPRVLEETVRALTATWSSDPASYLAGVARPVPFLVVRTRPMSGPSGLFIGVSIERTKPEHSLTSAAARFGISPREVQVLTLILDGRALNEIAEELHITSSTVQDHVESLLHRTETENRSGMIARILGWETSRE